MWLGRTARVWTGEGRTPVAARRTGAPAFDEFAPLPVPDPDVAPHVTWVTVTERCLPRSAVFTI